MRRLLLAFGATLLPSLVGAQTRHGPYARIAFLRPYPGHYVEFEAGYIRHLQWHAQANDPWTWYGWSTWASDRQRWFVYATFGHSAASLDSSVAPADDERDNILNVVPHGEFAGNGLYEFLPRLSRGAAEPTPAPRLELTTVELSHGAANAFEATLANAQRTLQSETLWYRMIAGGAPRYVRLRPRPSLSAVLNEAGDQALPNAAHALVARTTVEILNLRPTMSYGLTLPGRD